MRASSLGVLLLVLAAVATAAPRRYTSRDLFDRYDANGDGKVTVDEYTANDQPQFVEGHTKL